jgi:hypothetical protein
MLSMMGEVATAKRGEIRWRFRRHRFPNAAHLLFGACNTPTDEKIRRAFSLWVALRHQEFGADLGEVATLTSVGVLLTPRNDGVRPWDTTMIRTSGDLKLTAEEINAMKELWATKPR